MSNIVIIELGDYSQYEKIKYPAGELQVRITNESVVGKNIKVIARIKSSEDIMELLLLLNALEANNNIKDIYMPYLPYGRADRRFVYGDCFGAQVFLDLFHKYTIRTLDMHSWENVGDNIGNILPYEIINNLKHHCLVLFPDEGASRRYSLLFKDMNTDSCSKVRDPKTGELVKFSIPSESDLKRYKKILIYDDICDGGGTFIGIAKELEKYNLDCELNLFVTHGIFSKGTSILKKYFNNIYCTDSYDKNLKNNSDIKVMEIKYV